jgi:hypothetical protein
MYYYKEFKIVAELGFSGWFARFWRDADLEPETGEGVYSTGLRGCHDEESAVKQAEFLIVRIIEGERQWREQLQTTKKDRLPPLSNEPGVIIYSGYQLSATKARGFCQNRLR